MWPRLWLLARARRSGSVVRSWPSLRRRMSTLSSGETDGVGALASPDLGDAGGTQRDRGRSDPGSRPVGERHRDRRVFSGAVEHARDQVHVDRFGLEGPVTGQLDACSGPHVLTDPSKR